MRNRRFPHYPDDTDYNTNSNSYYDDLARKQKLFELLAKKIWEYDEQILEYFKRWEDNLATINDEVIEMMVKWLVDGILDDILGEIMNRKPEIHVSEDEPVTNFSNTYWFEIV